MSLVILTDKQWAAVLRAVNKINGLSGDGVINGPDGITITQAASSAPAIPPSPELFRVTVATDGGSAGNKTTQCSFTYAVASLGGTELGTGLAPTEARPPLGAMVVGEDEGWAYYKAGVFTLWSANEIIDTEACA